MQVQVTITLTQADEMLSSTPAELAAAVGAAVGAADTDTVQLTVMGSAVIPVPAPPTPPPAN